MLKGYEGVEGKGVAHQPRIGTFRESKRERTSSSSGAGGRDAEIILGDTTVELLRKSLLESLLLLLRLLFDFNIDQERLSSFAIKPAKQNVKVKDDVSASVQFGETEQE